MIFHFPLEIIKNIDAVIITYTHEDLWDDYAAKNIPKSVPILFKMILIKIY